MKIKKLAEYEKSKDPMNTRILVATLSSYGLRSSGVITYKINIDETDPILIETVKQIKKEIEDDKFLIILHGCVNAIFEVESD